VTPDLGLAPAKIILVVGLQLAVSPSQIVGVEILGSLPSRRIWVSDMKGPGLEVLIAPL
jgi:hypothetical protein